MVVLPASTMIALCSYIMLNKYQYDQFPTGRYVWFRSGLSPPRQCIGVSLLGRAIIFLNVAKIKTFSEEIRLYTIYLQISRIVKIYTVFRAKSGIAVTRFRLIFWKFTFDFWTNKKHLRMKFCCVNKASTERFGFLFITIYKVMPTYAGLYHGKNKSSTRQKDGAL